MGTHITNSGQNMILYFVIFAISSLSEQPEETVQCFSCVGRRLYVNEHLWEDTDPGSPCFHVNEKTTLVECSYPKRCTFVADQVLGDGKSNYIVEEKVERGCDEVDGTRWEHEPCVAIEFVADSEKHTMKGTGRKCYKHCDNNLCNDGEHNIEHGNGGQDNHGDDNNQASITLTSTLLLLLTFIF